MIIKGGFVMNIYLITYDISDDDSRNKLSTNIENCKRFVELSNTTYLVCCNSTTLDKY